MYQVYIRQLKRCETCGGATIRDIWVGAAHYEDVALTIGEMGVKQVGGGAVVLSLDNPFAGDLTRPPGEM